MLTQNHIDILKKQSGISLELAKLAQIKSFNKGISKEKIGISCEGVAFPYYNLNEELISYRIKLDKALPDGGKYLQKSSEELNLYFLKDDIPILKDKSKALYITEGEKKALALRQSLPKGSAICSIPGCWNWGQGSKLGAIFEGLPIANRDIYLIPDADFFSNSKVKEGYSKFIKCLLKKEARVSLIDIRSKGSKTGVDDFIKANGKESLEARIKNPFWTFENPTYLKECENISLEMIDDVLRKSIFLGGIQLDRLLNTIRSKTKDSFGVLKQEQKKYVIEFEKSTNKGVGLECFWDPSEQPITDIFKYITRALNADGNFYISNDNILIFVKNNKMVRITEGGDLSKVLSNKLPFYVISKQSSGYRTIPRDICASYLSEIVQYSNLRPLTKLANAPVVVGGKLICSPGYYRDEQTLYVGDEVKPKYTFERLKQIASYFPTKTDTDKAHILASMIFPVFNSDFMGAHPFILIQGDSVNLGKTSLSHICSIIHTGQEASDISFSSSDEENEKQIATQILETDFILIDNINVQKPIKSACLERVLTSSLPKFRLLGTNRSISRENLISLFMTLNQGSFSKDLITRVLPIFFSFENRQAMPSMFNPKKFAFEKREEILSEIVGLISLWQKNGRKKVAVNFPKYPGWAATINGVLHELGVKTFLSNYDEDQYKLDAITSGLISIGEMELEDFNTNKTEPRSAKEWRVKLEEVCGNILNSPNPRGKDTSVGMHLKAMLNRTFIAKVFDKKVEIMLKPENNNDGGRNKLYSFEIDCPKKENRKDTITVTPTDDWFKPQEEGENYSYEFAGKTYESKWWEGEVLNETLCFDLETTVEDHRDIKLVSAFDGDKVYRVLPNQLSAFFELHKEHNLVCHNSEFDIGNLLRFTNQVGLGLTLLRKRQIKDTLALSRLISLAEGRIGGNDLGSVTKKYLGIDLPKDVEVEIEGEKKPKKVSLSYGHFKDIKRAPRCFIHYNAYDVIAPFFLWNKLKRRAEELAIEHNVDPKKLLSYDHLVSTGICGVITSYHGFKLDQDAVLKKKQELEEQKEAALIELRKYDYDPEAKKTEKRTKDFIGKQDLFGSILEKLEKEHGISFIKNYHKGRKKEVYSAKIDDLKEFKHIPFIESHLEYERVSDTLSTFIAPLIGKDRVHSTYKAGKSTGRISSTKPNLQNVPTSGGIRDLYVAGPGRKLIIADYSGAELQVAGQYCLDNYGSSHFASMLNQGVDVHRYVASKYLGKPESQITKAGRAAGKPFNFGRLAGSGALTLQRTAKNDYGVDLTIEETKKIIQVWDDLFPEAKEHFKAANRALEKSLGISKYQTYPLFKTAKGETDNLSDEQIDWAWKHIAKIKDKFPRLAKYREDIINKKPSEELERAIQSTRVSILPKSGRVRGGCSYTEWCNNAALQSGQADITNTAWRKLLEEGFKVVNVVHDEFIVECDEGKAAIETQKRVEKIMLETAKQFNPDMTNMAVESEITDKWEKV